MLNSVDVIKAIISGALEGLTEFLPVSSTAHLLLFSWLIDFNSIKNNLFEIVIQFGAILAVCVVYRQKIFTVLTDLKAQTSQRFILNLILAFLPAAFIGSIFHDVIKQAFFSVISIAFALIIGGIVMIIVDFKKRAHLTADIDKINFKQSLLIGVFQCLAMVPGVSRSGATIIGGMLMKLNRHTAAEFSFFLSIPTIAAASFYDLYKNYSDLTASNFSIIFIGFLSAFISAFIVIKWFIAYVSKHNFIPFAIYRIILGCVILFFVL